MRAEGGGSIGSARETGERAFPGIPLGLIAVGMSGGVDSSVAALLLRRAGHSLVGLFLRNGVEVEEGKARSCCSASDARDARGVAADLGIPFHAVDFSPEFDDLVARFVEAYRAGRTPNPCARCNREIKFGALFRLARGLGADFVATGHYARLEVEGKSVRLRKGIDPEKDQSYQLFDVPGERLRRVLFPVGALRKDEVREIARKEGLRVGDKPDSQDLCFVPGGNYRELLRQRGLPPRPGPILDLLGREIGRHSGIDGFTVGQRRGLPAGSAGPRYVISVEPESAAVVVGSREEASSDRVQVSATNWIGRVAPSPGERFHATVKLRSRHAGVPAEIVGGVEGRVEALLECREPGVSPGQAAVFYDGEEVLGGGWIEPPSRPPG